MNNKAYFLAFNRMEHIGPRTVMKLLRRWPKLADLFQLSLVEMEQAGLSAAIAKEIHAFNFDDVDKDLRWAEFPNHHLLTWEDNEYPHLLKEISSPPLVLYARGDMGSCLKPTLAMVGSRKPSAVGLETARRFAFELAMNQITIVSGLALGIDASAHAGCLEAKGKTIAVMGTGIDNIYPRRHQELADKITENGLLLSEFPLKSPPIAGHFPRRNRIISGLSLATLVVEAAIRSGSLITARLALEQNRDVLAIPGSIYHRESEGCHYLLQQGAKLIVSSQDVIDELNLERVGGNGEIRLPLAIESENLVKCIGFEVTSVDQIIARSGLCVERVVCDLAVLELQGIVRAIPGGYMRCTI